MHFKLVIIQSDPLEAKITSERFTAYGCEVLATGGSGADALELTRTLRPDALVMEPFLPGRNCDDITEQLERELDFPLIKLTFTDSKNDTMANRFYNCGGDLFLVAPIDYAYCVTQMEKYMRLRRHQGDPIGKDALLRGCAKKHLMRMQMPMTIHGFAYLLDAVELAARDDTLLQNLVYGLYPSIGAIHGKPANNIERCIRTAVEQAFARGDMDLLFSHFGHTIREKTGKPANGDFISILTQMVRDELQLDAPFIREIEKKDLDR